MEINKVIRRRVASLLGISPKEQQSVEDEYSALAKGIHENPRCTCNHCGSVNECEWAHDLYNMDGDCLAVK